jgi:hypothetical protein
MGLVVSTDPAIHARSPSFYPHTQIDHSCTHSPITVTPMSYPVNTYGSSVFANALPLHAIHLQKRYQHPQIVVPY